MHNKIETKTVEKPTAITIIKNPNSLTAFIDDRQLHRNKSVTLGSSIMGIQALLHPYI